MSMISLFLMLPLINSLVGAGLGRCCKRSFLISIALTLAFLSLSVVESLSSHSIHRSLTIPLVDLDNAKLTLKFIVDRLTLVMFFLISLVSMIVNLYAFRYLYSDLNRRRFMMQLSLVAFSVVFLVMSGNLLTAFIGWQLIGFNLYWLFNHYHYDENANKAAKKKFVINRFGDMFFLLAVVLCLYFYATTDFSAILLLQSPNLHIFSMEIGVRTLILACVFVAVMTKSAQFPFHIWLPDTMQAPTPVSAIMHAGAINAGGFLLARLADGLLLCPSLLVIISCVGFSTMVIGSWFALTQPDVKRQLAYSTMSQMGYMVLQCGLGCFSGAIFHLIAHGFYKAWAFLNSGNQMFSVGSEEKLGNYVLSRPNVLLGTFLSSLPTVWLIIENQKFSHLISVYPLLMFFAFFTVIQLNYNIWSGGEKIINKLISIIFITIMFVLYLEIVAGHGLGPTAVYAIQQLTPVSFDLQIIGIIMACLLLVVYFMFYRRMKWLNYLYYFITNKLFIESVYRRFLLNPIRRLRDQLYKIFSSYYFLFLIVVFFLLVGAMFSYGVNLSRYIAIFVCLFLIVLLMAANRSLRLKDTVIYLVISQYALSGIGVQLFSQGSEKIVFYQIANTTAMAIALLYSLRKVKNGFDRKYIRENNFPWLATYFTVALFCLIGLPFTSSFIFHIAIVKQVLASMPCLLIGLLVAVLLLTISILHILQDYLFREKSIENFSVKLSNFDHCILAGLIAFNILNGFLPFFAEKIIFYGVRLL